jgi:diaminobutyrate-2-oxoglutarate transaminase
MKIFAEYESEVRSYSRSFPALYTKAKNNRIFDDQGKEYLDFFAGAGALNYGHNNDFIKEKVLKYLENDGIVHALDMSTDAKREFLQKFQEEILAPRGLLYKVMFCGSTGSNAVEAAIKLARKVKKRSTIFAFMGSFHGMSLGSLSLTSSKFARSGAGVALHDVVFVPFPSGNYKAFDSIAYMEQILLDDHSGIEKPAAIILETVQAEGGVYIADKKWLKQLSELCQRFDILLICDEIQTGCVRTGTFFSFERAAIIPDIVLLSKSISGLGLPMSLAVFKKELDIWQPGEHNGTFRGNQLAFVGASAALSYIKSGDIYQQVAEKEKIITDYIKNEILTLGAAIEHRGIGMLHGLDFSQCEQGPICEKLIRQCFENGLIIESAGRNETVLKIMPPLNIEEKQLRDGMSIIKKAIEDCI